MIANFIAGSSFDGQEFEELKELVLLEAVRSRRSRTTTAEEFRSSTRNNQTMALYATGIIITFTDEQEDASKGPLLREASSSFLSLLLPSALDGLVLGHIIIPRPESARWCESTRGKGTNLNLSRAWTLTRGAQGGPDSGQRAMAHWAQMDCWTSGMSHCQLDPPPNVAHALGWVWYQLGARALVLQRPSSHGPPLSLFGAYHHSHRHTPP